MEPTITMTSEILIVGRDSGFFVKHIGPRFPDLVLRSALDATAAADICTTSDILLIRTDQITAGLIGAMPRLRLIQALTTGTDHIEALPNLPPGIAIAAARGFHGPAMSELAFLFMLALARDVRSVLANQQQHRWDRRPQRLLFGKTAMLVGVGRIAEELAQRCKSFGMRVVGISTGRTSAPGFDAIHPRTMLRGVAGEADFLVVLTPYSRETHHLIDASVLDAMQPVAMLINIARGDVVDEAALVRALAAGSIAGAGLDVFHTEPLPPDNPLWDLPNVIITAHVGGMSDIYAEQVLPLLIDNLTAFVAGTPERMRYIVRPSTAKG
jgi:D-2-hydroxyacid dehydrogenase (NADP+)